jgi:iron complex transport system ATP-binding protein
MTPRIRTEDIAFSYSPEMARAVFRDVSLTVRTGDVFCLLGPNGIGKSTLLKCLSGILRIQKGRIFLNGRDLSEFKLPDVAKHIGYVPQGLTSAFPFRIKDIIVMGRAPHLSVLASPSRADMEIAHKAMETVGVAHLADRPCNSVSGGEWQLTLIGRALVQEPQILLLDEPTSHLDMGNQLKILQVIQDLANDGMTIVMASHFPDHAFLVANVVAILNNGQIAQVGPPEDVITEKNLKSTYGVDIQVVQLEEGGLRKACFPALSNSIRKQKSCSESLS